MVLCPSVVLQGFALFLFALALCATQQQWRAGFLQRQCGALEGVTLPPGGAGRGATVVFMQAREPSTSSLAVVAAPTPALAPTSSPSSTIAPAIIHATTPAGTPSTQQENKKPEQIQYLGGKEYGGWTFVDTNLGESSVIYSIGLGENISWDLGMIQKYNCNVFGYDPTPKTSRYISGLGEKVPRAKFHFKSEGIATAPGTIEFSMPANPNHVSLRGGSGKKEKGRGDKLLHLPVNTLKNWMQENGHAKIDILKMDVEGMEYELLKSWTSKEDRT
eukprot:g19388.t1